MYYLLQSIEPQNAEYAFVDFTTGNFHGDQRTGGNWNSNISLLLEHIVVDGFNFIDSDFDTTPHSNIYEYTDHLNSDPCCVSCSLVASFNTINDILNMKQTHPELLL